MLAAAGCAPGGVTPDGRFTDDPARMATTTTAVTFPRGTVVGQGPGGGYNGSGFLTAFCDAGNRVYVYEGGQRAGVAAVPDPNTCPEPP
jgi:hypothetical protein